MGLKSLRRPERLTPTPVSLQQPPTLTQLQLTTPLGMFRLKAAPLLQQPNLSIQWLLQYQPASQQPVFPRVKSTFPGLPQQITWELWVIEYSETPCKLRRLPRLHM